MRKKSLVLCMLLVSVLVCSTVLAGCGEKAADEKSNKNAEDSIIIGISVEAPTLDPQMTSSHQARQIYCNLYDNLVEKNESGEFVGSLADNWTVSDDKLEYTFKLREGVKFHNGEELKASDVKFSFDRGMESPHVAFFYGSFSSVEVVDEYTVKVTLNSPAATFLEIMTLPQTSIVSEKAVTEFGDDYGRNPVGTGPYKFEKWNSGENIIFSGNEDYFKGAPSIKSCEFRIITDKNTGYIVLEKGEIDVYYDLSSVDRQRTIDNVNLTYDEIGSIAYEHIIINNENEKFSDVKVRQALAYAVDRESILIAGNNGVGVLADSQIPSTMFGYSDKVKSYEYNAEKAKALLEEAGYKDGFKCVIKVNSGYREKEAQVIQANLADIGIKADIAVVEWGTLLTELGNGNFEISLVGKNLHLDDPALTLNNSFSTKFIGAGGNFYRYSNAELDKKLEQSLVEQDQTVREKLFEEILTVLHEEVPNIPISWNINNIGYNKNLKGVKALPISHYEVYNFSW